MEIFEKKTDLRHFLKTYKKGSNSVGFAPTMGALHEGHMALIKKSVSENDVTVCSIFVNPIQFNNPSDLEKYPRTLEQDYSLLRAAGCSAVFAPSVSEMYPQPTEIEMNFGYQNTILEGSSRPGHFSGVGIVVSNLFNIVQPDNVYFGQKDFQQCLIIKQLIRELCFPVELHIVPTMRESDGLAMSSRNKRLTPVQREISPVIYQSLKMAESSILSMPLPELKQLVFKHLSGTGEIIPEYLEILNFESGKAADEIAHGQAYAICIAARLGDVRLIDNIIINT